MNMKTPKLVLALVAALGIYGALQVHAADPAASATTASQASVQSLRGRDVSAQDAEPGNYKQERDHDPGTRAYVQQPPLIPHVTEGYQITANFNKCMDCHSWSRYKETGATKVSLTHFKSRDGQELSNISPRRYFCTQCHVPQTDAKPLVGNTFKKAEGLK
jgi:nitrate reductase (cytochrome), electron transfer subunit